MSMTQLEIAETLLAEVKRGNRTPWDAMEWLPTRSGTWLSAISAAPLFEEFPVRLRRRSVTVSYESFHMTTRPEVGQKVWALGGDGSVSSTTQTEDRVYKNYFANHNIFATEADALQTAENRRNGVVS